MSGSCVGIYGSVLPYGGCEKGAHLAEDASLQERRGHVAQGAQVHDIVGEKEGSRDGVAQVRLDAPARRTAICWEEDPLDERSCAGSRISPGVRRDRDACDEEFQGL